MFMLIHFRQNLSSLLKDIANPQFKAWLSAIAGKQKSGGCCVGLGRLLHWIVGWIVPAIQFWLLYLLWDNIDSRAVPDGFNELNTGEKVGCALFLFLDLAPHLAQGFGLVLLPFYRKKSSFLSGKPEESAVVINEWVEQKRDTLSFLDKATVVFVGLVELGITGTACYLGLKSAYQQDTFVVAILRITAALFVERLDEKVFSAWKLFATPQAYQIAKEVVNESYGTPVTKAKDD